MIAIRAFALACVCSLAACAGFSGNTLPRVDTFPALASAPAQKPSVALSVSFRQFLNGAPVTLLRGTAENAHRTRLAGILEESGYFSAVHTDGTEADLTLEVAFKDEGSGSMGMAFLTGLTFYLVPSFTTDNFVLDAKLTERASGQEHEVHLEEFVTQWQQILLLPLMPFKLTPVQVYKAQGQLWRNLAVELAKSGMLASGAPSAARASALGGDQPQR